VQYPCEVKALYLEEDRKLDGQKAGGDRLWKHNKSQISPGPGNIGHLHVKIVEHSIRDPLRAHKQAITTSTYVLAAPCI